MKAKEVLALLRITRPTLTKYVKTGILKVRELPNGQYDYDEDSVYAFFNKGVKRGTYIYARVSTQKQKVDLHNQIELLKQFCFSQGYTVAGLFSDVASGINFEKRTGLFQLLDLVLANKVERVVITYKDRLSRVGYELFHYLFAHYNCEIVVMSKVGSEKLDSQEVFEEIVSLLHCYSMRLYSKHRVQRIKEVLQDEQNSDKS